MEKKDTLSNTMQNKEIPNFDKVNLAFSLERLNNFYPAIYNKFFTKVYRNADKFHDYRLSLYLKALAYLGQTMDKESIFLPIEIETAKLMLAFDNPTFFVAQDLLTSMMQTDIKQNLMLDDLYLPFLAFTVIFPKNCLRTGNEEICYVDISYVCGKYLGKETYGLKFNFITDTGRNIFKTVGENFDFKSIQFTEKIISDDPNYIELSDDEHNLVNQLIQAICSLLIVLNIRPQYIEHGSRNGYHKKQKKDIWTPNIIGANYRIQYAKKDSEKTGGTVRLHWRRGHTRLQHYGIGNSQSKTIWLEPMLVGKQNNK